MPDITESLTSDKNYSEITIKAQQEVEEYKLDFLRAQMREIMHLNPACPTDDETFIKELQARMTRLNFLEEQLEEQAVMLNCKKADVMVEMVVAEKMRSELEKTEKQLADEREENRKALLEFENEVSRNAQLLEGLQGNYTKLLDDLHALKDQTKRTGFWGKLVESMTAKPEMGGKGEPAQETPEKVELLGKEK